MKPFFGAVSIIAGAAVLATADPATAQSVSPPDNKAAIEKVVRDYILNNPEIVMEAIAKLREKKRAAELAADRATVANLSGDIFNDPQSPTGGNVNGDVTVVEFFDYRCGVCKRVHPIVAELVKTDPNIRRVYKEWPILGPDSVLASRAAIASRKQGKYHVFHDAMMETKGALDEEGIMQLAGAVGLDVDKLRADMAAPEVEEMLSRNYTLASRLRLNGTPAFLIGNQIIRGGQDLDSMRALVAEARRKKE